MLFGFSVAAGVCSCALRRRGPAAGLVLEGEGIEEGLDDCFLFGIELADGLELEPELQSVTATARALGVSRWTIYRCLERAPTPTPERVDQSLAS